MEHLKELFNGNKKYIVIGSIGVVLVFLYIRNKSSSNANGTATLPTGNLSGVGGNYTSGGTDGQTANSPSLMDSINAQLALLKGQVTNQLSLDSGQAGIQLNTQSGLLSLQKLASDYSFGDTVRYNDEKVRQQNNVFTSTLGAVKQSYDETMRQNTQSFDFLYKPVTSAISNTTATLTGRTPAAFTANAAVTAAPAKKTCKTVWSGSGTSMTARQVCA